MASDSSSSIRWLIRFLVFGTVFYLLSRTRVLESWLAAYYTPWLVKLSSLCLSVIGVGHQVTGHTFLSGHSKFTVSTSCTGIFVFLLLCTAVLSFPAAWRSKVWGVGVGAAVLSILNIARIVLIVAVGRQFSETFWSLHVVIGQIIVITGIAAFFMFWLNRTAAGNIWPKRLPKSRLIRHGTLFLCGYGLGLIGYHLFLNSALGRIMTRWIELHSLALIRWMGSLFTQWFAMDGFPSVSFNSGCLSSPVMVILAALVFALPWPWRVKLPVLILGFLPVFYLYHLLRAVATALSFALGQGKQDSSIYQCFGQFVLAGTGILLFRLEEQKGRDRKKRQGRIPQLAGMVWVILLAGAGAAAGGWLFNQVLIPRMMEMIGHLTGTADSIYYDFQLTISTMAYFQCFILTALLAGNQRPWLENITAGAIGTVLLFIFMTVCFLLIETLDLFPHVGILKTLIVAVPFLIYYGLRKWMVKAV